MKETKFFCLKNQHLAMSSDEGDNVEKVNNLKERVKKSTFKFMEYKQPIEICQSVLQHFSGSFLI